MLELITNPMYGVVANLYLYRKTKREPMTTKTVFPCIAVAKDGQFEGLDTYAKADVRKKVLVVALRGNQDPPLYLNCIGGGYPHDGRLYCGYDVVGYPIRDTRTGDYVRVKNWSEKRESLMQMWRKLWKRQS